MTTLSSTQQGAFGSAILDRFADLPTKTGWKSLAGGALSAFQKTHAAFLAAEADAKAARDARDTALADVGHADELLDAAIMKLADALIGAGLGTRTKPFASFSRYSPSALCELAYKRELDEARALVAKIGKQKSAPKKELAAVSKAADAVEKALTGLTKPQAKADKALAARDALLPDWQKSLSRLRVTAKAAFVDDPATYGALFAQAVAEQAPTKKRARKSGAGKPGATQPAAGGAGNAGAST